MSEHRSAVTRVVGSPPVRRHRWLIGSVAVLLAGGLAFGGVGVPVSADEINAVGNLQASAEADGDCVTAAAGTGEADGSVTPEPDPDGSQLQANGQGTATVSVCTDDLGQPPVDPGDPGPGDPGGMVPGDPGGIVPGDPGGIVPGDLEDLLPGDGGGSDPGGPGGGIPGDVDDLVPGGGGGVIPGGPGGGGPGGGDGVLRELVGDGLGRLPWLLGRLTQSVPSPVDGGDPDGNTGSGPATGPSPNGPTPGSVDVGGGAAVNVNSEADAEGGTPLDAVLGAGFGRDVPGSALTAPTLGATLPRTGGGLGSGALRFIAFLGLGRALFGLAQRRRPAAARPLP